MMSLLHEVLPGIILGDLILRPWLAGNKFNPKTSIKVILTIINWSDVKPVNMTKMKNLIGLKILADGPIFSRINRLILTTHWNAFIFLTSRVRKCFVTFDPVNKWNNNCFLVGLYGEILPLTYAQTSQARSVLWLRAIFRRTDLPNQLLFHK